MVPPSLWNIIPMEIRLAPTLTLSQGSGGFANGPRESKAHLVACLIARESGGKVLLCQGEWRRGIIFTFLYWIFILCKLPRVTEREWTAI